MRQEQIKQAVIERYGCECRASDHFTEGAAWADNNPSEATVLRIVRLYKLWYTTESGMGIVDFIKEHWSDEQ